MSKQKDIPTAPDVPTKTREPMLFAKGGKVKEKKLKRKQIIQELLQKNILKEHFSGKTKNIRI